MRTKILDIVARLGARLYGVAMALLILLPALVTVADSDRRSTAVLSPLATVADAAGTAQGDAMAEGTDVLPLAYHDAPAELWNALRETMPDAYDDDVPGIGTFYVPVGSALFFEQGMFLATVDGWFVCIHGETNDVCSPTGPVIPTAIPTRTASSVYDYMTGGTTAQCGTDAQCRALDNDRAAAASAIEQAPSPFAEELTVVNVAHVASTVQDWRGWRLAEDGSLMPPSFYDRTTATGATQAVCDHLGKRRVPDATYGHRCV